MAKKDDAHNSDKANDLLSQLSQGENNPLHSERWDEGSHPNSYREIPDSMREKISSSMEGKLTGEDHPMWGETHSEEAKEKMSEAMKERLSNPEDHPMYGTERDFSEEHIEKLREASTGAPPREGAGICDWYDVGEEMRVQGTFERDVAQILLGEIDEDNIDNQVKFNYWVDFVIPDKRVIEVKGWCEQDDIERAQEFINEYPEWTYILIGPEDTSDIPHDVFVEWDNRERLREVI
jgi:hypothetical protein